MDSINLATNERDNLPEDVQTNTDLVTENETEDATATVLLLHWSRTTIFSCRRILRRELALQQSH